MRILFLVSQLTGGGAERQCRNLAQALRERDTETHVAYLRPGPGAENLDLEQDFHHCLNIRNNYNPQIAARIGRLADSLAPTLVMTWTAPLMDIVGGSIALTRGLPWVLAERNSAPLYLRGLKNRLRLHLGRRAAAIIANSHEGAAYWRERGFGGSITVVGNVVPVAHILEIPPADPGDLGFGPADQLVVCAGRFTPQKNLLALIEAFALLDDLPWAKLLLCGDGEQRQEITDRIGEKGLSERVRMTGFVSAATVWSWMKASRCFVLPSLYEGRSNALQEAAICGCGIVASDIGQNRTAMEGMTARFVDPGDPQAFAAAIRAALLESRTQEYASRFLELNESIVATYQDVFRRLTG